MIGKRFTTVLDFTCACQTVHPSELKGADVVISAPVGDGPPGRCPNRPADVKTIQQALNRFKPLDGGPLEPLVPDGLCGPKTRKAIGRFQEKWNLKFKGQDVRDAIVDPEGPTIDRLRKGPGAPATPPEQLARHLPRLTEVLTAARAALQLAKFHYNNPGGLGFGQLAVAKFERHFHGGKTGNPVRHVAAVDRTFLDMQVAVGHIPQGIILLADEPANFAGSAYLFTFAGGYHLRRPEDTFQGIHQGSIYLCPLSRVLDRDRFVYCLIHELAHYVAPPAPGITDLAYFHKFPAKYAALTPAQSLRNADCYAQFAYEVVGKPNFNVSLNKF